MVPGHPAHRHQRHPLLLYLNTYRMIQHLNGGRATNTFEKRLQNYLRHELLALDVFGLKALQDPAPEDLYDVINERYERGSILLTSNRTQEEWPELFGNPLLASAGLDRLTHGATMVEITGRSFRAHGTKPPKNAGESDDRDLNS